MNSLSLTHTLSALRHQAISQGIERLASHQLEAHWSIAYACEKPPETWEIYRVPSLYLMPCTDFYVSHAKEIQEALKPAATWELLRTHAIPKLELDASMSKQECQRHAYPGKVQYYDATMRRWCAVDIPRIRWFDDRNLIRESLSETKAELRAKVARNLQRCEAAAARNATMRNLRELAACKYYLRKGLPERLKEFGQEKALDCAWLARLEATPDFGKALFAITRGAENNVRQARGIPLVGEAWVSETELCYRVRQLFPETEVIHHGQPSWLGRQHLDIWLPEMNVAIEYQGEQHFRPIDFFGGEQAFRKAQERDNRKRELCQKHNVRLVEIAYDHDIDDITLSRALGGLYVKC